MKKKNVTASSDFTYQDDKTRKQHKHFQCHRKLSLFFRIFLNSSEVYNKPAGSVLVCTLRSLVSF